jgi:hypothetical protein
MYLQYSKYRKKQKLMFVGILEATNKQSKFRSWIRIRNPVYRSKDPNPFKNVTDPEHWF